MKSLLNKYEITRGNKLTKGFFIFTIFFIIFLLSTPWWLGRSDIRKITEFLYILSLAQMWNLLAGYGGLLSVGQQLFVGIGAYCLVIFDTINAITSETSPASGITINGSIPSL